MESGSVDPAWRELFELLNDVCRQEDADSMLETVMSELGSVIPADRGAALNEMRRGIPYCVSWPDYAENLVPRFNSHFNTRCPIDYDWKHHCLGPVSWKQYADSEYDTDFNRPMRLGHSLGFGWRDAVSRREMVMVIHRRRGGLAFTDKDLQSIQRIRPLFARIYNLARELESLRREYYAPAELDSETVPLSSREAQVAELLLHRISMREIAVRLGISPRTVERHALHIYQKLKVSNRRELAKVLCPGSSPLSSRFERLSEDRNLDTQLQNCDKE